MYYIIVDYHKASSLASSMKCIASTESNAALQDIMFKCSRKYEILDEELEAYRKNSEEIQLMIENIKKQMTQPLKVECV